MDHVFFVHIHSYRNILLSYHTLGQYQAVLLWMIHYHYGDTVGASKHILCSRHIVMALLWIQWQCCPPSIFQQSRTNIFFVCIVGRMAPKLGFNYNSHHNSKSWLGRCFIAIWFTHIHIYTQPAEQLPPTHYTVNECVNPRQVFSAPYSTQAPTTVVEPGHRLPAHTHTPETGVESSQPSSCSVTASPTIEPPIALTIPHHIPGHTR